MTWFNKYNDGSWKMSENDPATERFNSVLAIFLIIPIAILGMFLLLIGAQSFFFIKGILLIPFVNIASKILAICGTAYFGYKMVKSKEIEIKNKYDKMAVFCILFFVLLMMIS